MHLQGKVALVTGGAQGLGKAYSEALLKRGMKVCLVDVQVQQGEATVRDFCSRFGEKAAIFVKCDVSNENDMKAAFQLAKSTFKRLDLVVNNAGISDERKVSKMIDINLKGVVIGTNLAVEHMAKDKGGNGGVIINVGSTAGLVPVFLTPVYAGTKFGVVGFTRSWAHNPFLGDMGLRFATLCPGYTDTPILDKEKVYVPYRERALKMMEEVGINKVETVVEGFMQLVDDEDNNGAVMDITVLKGIRVRRMNLPRKSRL